MGRLAEVVAMVMFMALVPGSSHAATPCASCGDVNCDGRRDAVDALMIAQVAQGFRNSLPCPAAADVNSDAAFDMADARAIGQELLELHDSSRCRPVLSAVVPSVVDSGRTTHARVSGWNLSPQVVVLANGNNVSTTLVDCGTLEITLPPSRPGVLSLTATDPQGESSAPLELRVEGAFRDVSASAQLSFVPARGDDLLPVAGGVALGDFDGDGEVDLFIPNHDGPNALFRNRGDGTFQNVAAQAGVEDALGAGRGSCIADYDNDGDADLYVTNRAANRLYRNEGDGTFVEIGRLAGVADTGPGSGCSWGDIDRDGYLDLYVANHLDESDRSIFFTRQFGAARRSGRLYHNLGDGRFEDVTSRLGDEDLVTGAAFGASFVDYDNDGDADLYLVNDFGREIQPNVLWRNDSTAWRPLELTDVSTRSGANVGIFGMGLAIGDYDADGRFDFFISNIGQKFLLHARQDGRFENRARNADVEHAVVDGKYSVGWGTSFLDFDNDGREDLYLVTGYLDSDPLTNDLEQSNVLLHNRGDGKFEDVSEASGADDSGIGRGLAVADLNHDGFLDLVVVNLGQGVVLLQNTGRSAGHWLELTLRGRSSNRDAVGARVTAELGSRRLIREVSAGGSGMSQNALELHFGLGSAVNIDALDIHWPSGTRQTLRNIRADQRLFIDEP